MNNNTEKPLNSDIYYCIENDAVIENVIVEEDNNKMKNGIDYG